MTSTNDQAGDTAASPRRQQPVDGLRRCHYVDDPAHRPGCTLTATVRYGAVALCPSCNAALRQLGNRLVGILHGCLKTRTPYDEATAWNQHTQRVAA